MQSRKYTSDFKAEMDYYLKTLDKDGTDKRTKFIPEKFLRQLFTKENIDKHLTTYALNEEERTDLAKYIKNAAMKTYAILVLLEYPNRILRLKQTEPNIDARLFKQSDPASRSYNNEGFFRTIEPLQDIADRFYEKQWLFPPYLSFVNEIPSFDEKFFKFPFNTKPKPLGGGGFGEVFKVKIDDDYIRYPDDFEPGSYVTYKRIKRRDEEWERLKREVKVVKARQHSNVTPTFASFIACPEMERFPRTSQCLYIIMPLAEMDMDKWLEDKPKIFDPFSREQIQDHIWSAIWGLISGLTYIHREIGTQVGFHGDIKPKNILLFKDRHRLTWKFTDFGSSNLKASDDTGDDRFPTTQKWAPEEFYNGFTEGEGQSHGRLGDVWSLGCVFLLLATMLVYGWDPEGVKKFAELRKNKPFYESRQDINKWMGNLRDQINKQDRFHELLSLIEKMLARQSERIFSWEVNIDLFRLLNPGKTEEDYDNHLRTVIQLSREVDKRMIHNPLKRARGHLREDSYLGILMDYKWYDALTTDAQKAARETRRSPPGITGPEVQQSIPAREDLLVKIADAFSSTKTVVLYGLRGIGKTRLAKQYMAQVVKNDNFSIEEDDIFMVPAESTLSFQNGYRAIVATHHRRDEYYSDDRTLFKRLKRWFEVRIRSHWFMLVDGLDHPQDAEYIATHLPSLSPHSKGEILITTRNRALVENFRRKETVTCIEMEPPHADEFLQIFERAFDRKLSVEESEYAKRISDVLWCPQLVDQTAKYVHKRRDTTLLNMARDLAKGRLKDIKSIQPDLASWFLKPTLTNHLDLDDHWSDELQLLFLLSIFDNRTGLDDQLICSERESHEEDEVQRSLNTLVDCSLIRKEPRDSSSSNRYYVNSAVQYGVLAWVESMEGAEGFLQRFNKALSMLFRSYDQRKRHLDRSSANVESLNKEFLPHFEHIAHYTRTLLSRTRQTEWFMFSDRSIQAIITFTQDGDHDNALWMLELGRAYFFLKDIGDREDDDKKIRGIDLYFILNRSLIKAMISSVRSKGLKMSTIKDDLTSQVRGLIEESRSIKASPEIVYHGRTLNEWRLKVLLVRILWERAQYEEARKECHELEKIKIQPGLHKPKLTSYFSSYTSSVELVELQKLAISASMEEGLLNLANGQDWKSKKNLKLARKHWKTSQQVFQDVHRALNAWDSSNVQQLQEIKLRIADADARVGDAGQLRAAIQVFEEEYERICEKYGDECMLAWNMEFKLSSAKLKAGGSFTGEAIESLSKLHAIFKERLGEDHGRTIDVANQLANHSEPSNESEVIGEDESEELDSPSWPKLGVLLLLGVGAMIAMTSRNRKRV